MTQATAGDSRGENRADWTARLLGLGPRLVQWLRTATGLVMFSFLLCHLTNHAVGIISWEAMQHAHEQIMWIWWEKWAHELLEYSFLFHILLAYWSVYRRRRLIMPIPEATQLLFGLSIPLLVADHVLWNQGFVQAAKDFMTYPVFMYHYAIQAPEKLWMQIPLILIAWAHVCFGLNYWLRVRSWFRATQSVWLILAVLLPLLASLGVFAAVADVRALAGRDPGWAAGMDAKLAPQTARGAEHRAALVQWFGIFLGGIALTLAARAARAGIERRRGMVRLTYPDGKVVVVARGTTILEASRTHKIAHASVCGGRGRCSTCRVRLGPGAETQPGPGEIEEKLLHRIGAPPTVRLACQLRPTGDLDVAPMLAAAKSDLSGKRLDPSAGRELVITVLFGDLRGFTSFSEHRLPFDTVFVLNRYFAEMGHAVEQAGGRIDKFIGDGVMALFGLEGGADHGAQAALAAVRAMFARLDQINHQLEGELKSPLRLGVGLHTGPAIVGEMGYGPATHLTAIGDTVNTASRIESMTKELKAELALSLVTAQAAGLDVARFRQEHVPIRGRVSTLDVVAVDRVADL